MDWALLGALCGWLFSEVDARTTKEARQAAEDDAEYFAGKLGQMRERCHGLETERGLLASTSERELERNRILSTENEKLRSQLLGPRIGR